MTPNIIFKVLFAKLSVAKVLKLGGKLVVTVAILLAALKGIDLCTNLYNHPGYPGAEIVATLVAFAIGPLVAASILYLFAPKKKREEPKS